MMKLHSGRRLSWWTGLALIVLFCGVAHAAENEEYKPVMGQQGKDVIWIPTCQELVDKLLDMAKITSRDYVIDLGSGDGRMVITAAKRGARALGVEYNPKMVELSKREAAKAGVAEKTRFIEADLFTVDFSEASVVTLFLLEDLNLKLRPQILKLKPGTRIVSNTFTMGDWEADQRANASCGNGLFWIVPAQVEGRWKLAEGELALRQNFQKISGSLTSGGTTYSVEGRLSGDVIMFSTHNGRFLGRLSGKTIEGEFEALGKREKWTAAKIE